MTISLLLVIFAGFFIVWLVGADSLSPSFAPVVSAGSTGVLRGALLAGIFGLFGAIFQGGNVTETIGSDLLSGATIGNFTGSIILLVAGGLITIGVLSHIPVPTVFAVVGSILGAGLGMETILNMAKIKILVIVWVVIPFVAIFMGYCFAKILRHFLSKKGKSRKILELLALATGAFSAYAGGANHVGLGIGIISTTWNVPLRILLVMGGALILLGAWIGGPRIVNAVSKEYSEMGVRRSICALATASIIAQVATQLGIPISFNEAIIPSVIGSGLVTGRSRIQLGKITKTTIAWIITFFASIGITFALVQIFVA